ncbi:DUF3987 domain-containing protein [Bradyrhizobium diazoefficiens]|uniref:YfjI family protein n=1 Tax=Bradyrhizobium diazoefficiens TaxID=1355477 RepID=UPI00190D4F96|nr:YfjI family protein [Bradyrhizobium diazoefficiens]QQO34497.1 DUF3987 domain-containing protein [Bradyrhizobium diazoefficiens]
MSNFRSQAFSDSVARDAAWKKVVGHWQATGEWSEANGPRPGESDCRVPAYLLTNGVRVADAHSIAPDFPPGVATVETIAPRSSTDDAPHEDNAARTTEAKSEAPRALMREPPAADPFPVDALGPLLGSAARAINDRVQAPIAICGQAVLAAATLTVQGHADVELPTGHARPTSGFFISIAATGERKSAVDREALWPIHKREAALRAAFVDEMLQFENAEAAWKKAREVAMKSARGDRARIKTALDALGAAPIRPLTPVLTCNEPTFEGLCKLLAVGQPSVGIFAAEGGQFIGGHGMSDDAKLRTATGLSAVWDGEPLKRVRALDGVTILPGRRVALHLMAQPDVGSIWLGDRLLLEQGLLSRVLLTAPEPASGTRIWREASAKSDSSMLAYGRALLDILESPMAMADGRQNELTPRSVPLSMTARRLWIAFHDHIEARLGIGGELEPIRGLANKLPEHAARIAAVLTLFGNIDASEVGSTEMEAGIALAQHYAAEAIRLFGASRASSDLHEAQALLTWLRTVWLKQSTLVSLPDIYQRGPNSIRDKAHARRAVNLLIGHGWLVAAPAGEVAGSFRREVWEIVGG